MSASCVSSPTRAPLTMEMLPSSGSIAPEISLNSVDLPVPFAPTSPMRLPAWSVRLTSFSTVFIAKDLVTFCTVKSIISLTPMEIYSAHQRPLAPQGSTPPQVTGSTISSAATRPPWVRPTVMVSMLFSTAG